jgi:hypothetical protein
MSVLKLGKASKIRPDNLALYSTKKVFFGNPHKGESYMLREGIDAIGLKLVLIPKNIKKIKEMIDLALESSSKMSPKQIRKIESLLFDFLYNKPNYDISSHIKIMLEDFSRMVITAFKFAESNERSVESTFFLYIIANPSYSVIKDMIVLIGLLTLYLPLVYWGIILRLSKNLKQLKEFFKGKSQGHYIDMFVSVLSLVLLNLFLMMAIIKAAEWLFISDASINTDFCFGQMNISVQDWLKPGYIESSTRVKTLVKFFYNLLNDFGFSFRKNLDHVMFNIFIKMLLFFLFLIVLNMVIMLLKKSLLKIRKTHFNTISKFNKLLVGIEETFTRMFIGVYVAAYGIYKYFEFYFFNL